MGKTERDKIKAEAKRQAAAIMAEENQKVKLEEVLSEYETQLTEIREAEKKAIAENTKLTDKIGELEVQLKALLDQVAGADGNEKELKAELENTQKLVDDLKAQLESAKKEAALQVRVKDLEEAGLLSVKAADKQKSKIMTMSDDEFADYKSELAELISEKIQAHTKTIEAVVAEPIKPASPEEPTAVVADVDPEQKVSMAHVMEMHKIAASLVGGKTTTATVTGRTESGVDRKLLSEYEQLWAE